METYEDKTACGDIGMIGLHSTANNVEWINELWALCESGDIPGIMDLIYNKRVGKIYAQGYKCAGCTILISRRIEKYMVLAYNANNKRSVLLMSDNTYLNENPGCEHGLNWLYRKHLVLHHVMFREYTKHFSACKSILKYLGLDNIYSILRQINLGIVLSNKTFEKMVYK